MRVSIAVFLVCIFSLPVFSQMRFSGFLQTSVYTFETPTVAQGEFFQGVRLRAEPEKYRKAFFNTYFRVAKRGEADWEERVYNLYVDYKTSNSKFRIRAGRQFVYQGVINGTLDGILLGGNIGKSLKVKVFGGAPAPFGRELKALNISDNTALGAYASYRFPWNCKLDVSYFQRKRDGNTNWHLVGGAFSGKVKSDWFYQFQIDHNLESKKLQGVRARLNYYHNHWALWGEYNAQKPRVFEDSYFTIFQIEAYDQARGGLTYQLNQYQFGLQYLYTNHYVNQTNQVIATAGNRWGLLGFVLQEGYGGDNIGVYGDIRYLIIPQLTAKLYASYYNFERQTTVISEDATSFSAGLEWRPVDRLSLQAEVQQSNNSFYKDDWRGLFRLFFHFGK